MSNLSMFIFPTEETSFKCVAMDDSHTIDFRSDSILFVLSDTVGAAVDVKSWLHLLHRHREQTNIFFLSIFAREKECIES